MTRSEYVHGSTARSLAAHEVNIHPIREERRRARRNIHFDARALFVVLGAGALMLLVVFANISLQTDVTRARERYSAMRSEYEDLKRSNDLYHERIVSKVDMNEVARIAEQELGMKVAEEGQIISYSGQIDDYVKQYSDIPNAE